MSDERARALSALMHLDPGMPYDSWNKAGMGAIAAGLTLDDIDNWSAPAANYKGRKDINENFKNVTPDGGTTAATLFMMAFNAGWKDPAKRAQAANGGRATVPMPSPRKAPVTPIKQAETGNASHVWQLCYPAPSSHPYILKKRGNATGLRVYPETAPPLIIRGMNVAGCLAVPCIAPEDGRLLTLQFIPAEGDKLNLAGASFGNGYFTVGDIADSRRVFIVEGIGQAWACWQATGDAAAVCFGAGRMLTVAKALRDKYPAARLVLVPDRGKEPQAESIARDIGGEWAEMPPDKPANYDANDFALEHDTEALGNLLERTKAPPQRFRLLSGAELCAAKPMRFLVRGVLPLTGLAALFGASGSGKSFLAIDICCAVASGEPEWFGRRVTQAPVTYCALEGEAGLGKRIAAWTMHRKQRAPDLLRFVTQPFDLLASSDVPDLAAAIVAAGGRDGLVVIDTLNRSAPGADENSSKDMGLLIGAAKHLQGLVGGLVLLVHHTGKDASKGLRGHSSLHAALDAAIEVARTDSRREWSIAKSKDDTDGAAYPFKLEIVTVGMDDEHEPVTSCVILPDESLSATKRESLPRGGNQKIALDTLAEPLRNSKEFDKEGAPKGHPCIRFADAVAIVAERMPTDAKHKNQRANEAIGALVAKRIYGLKGEWLWRF